jgi:hypothetical protein
VAEVRVPERSARRLVCRNMPNYGFVGHVNLGSALSTPVGIALARAFSDDRPRAFKREE